MCGNIDDVEFLRQLLLSMRNEPIEYDVVFVVNGERFPTHKVVAAAASPVLRTMFTSGMKESTQREITLHNLDTDTWRRIDAYIYQGTIRFNDLNDALDMLDCSTRFQFDRIREMCITYLRQVVGRQNCIRILQATDL